MSQENAKKFTELLNKDEELQKKVKAATEAYTGDKTDERAVFNAALSPIAKEAGYEFSFDEVVELAKSSEGDELSEDEAAVAVGGSGCFFIGTMPHAEDARAAAGDEGCGACAIIGIGFGKF